MVIRNQRGQVAVEFILLTVVLASLSLFIMKELRKNEFVARMVDRPWSQLTGMIENGVWGPADKTRPLHPNYRTRNLSLKGER